MIGEVNMDLRLLPAAIQMLFYALFAYWMTDLSTTTLVGETSKAVTMPEKASASRILALFCCLAGVSVIINSKSYNMSCRYFLIILPHIVAKDFIRIRRCLMVDGCGEDEYE